jgi:dTDP-4-amino-4,6-dideoxygalactose transaminase
LGAGLSKWGDKHYDRVTGGRDPVTLSPNYRITEPQAAVAATQLERHDGIVARRIALGDRLSATLDGVAGLHLPRAVKGDTHSYWYYLVRLDLRQLTEPRDRVRDALEAEGVLVEGSYLPRPVPEYPVFRDQNFFAGRWPLREAGLTEIDYTKVEVPGAKAMLADCLVFKLYEEMPEGYIDGVAAAVQKVLRAYRR